MSSDVYLHGVKDNQPVYHRWLGGTGVARVLRSFPDEYERTEVELELGWYLLPIRAEWIERLIRWIEDDSSYLTDASYRQAVWEAKESIATHWYLWVEY